MILKSRAHMLTTRPKHAEQPPQIPMPKSAAPTVQIVHTMNEPIPQASSSNNDFVLHNKYSTPGIAIKPPLNPNIIAHAIGAQRKPTITDAT